MGTPKPGDTSKAYTRAPEGQWSNGEKAPGFSASGGYGILIRRVSEAVRL